MQCSSCYSNVPRNAKFCSECGTTVEQTDDFGMVETYRSSPAAVIAGEIRDCAHCSGSTTCVCDTCKSRHHVEYGVVICTVCQGKGSVWVGPG